MTFLSAVLATTCALAANEGGSAKDKPPKEDIADDVSSIAGEGPKIRLFGRVLARMDTDQRDAYVRDFDIPQARIGVQAAIPFAEAVVSGDFASKSILKDAFVRGHDATDRFRLYAGQFKAPFLARELESTWKLPRIQRGLVDDYLVETHDMGGRRLGAMGEVKLKFLNFKASAGIFRGTLDSLTGERTREDAAARVTVRPFKPLTVGASTYLAQFGQGLPRHATAGEFSLKGFNFNLTGEAVFGRLALGPFNAALALLRYDWELGEAKQWLLQPHVSAEILQLRGANRGRGWSAGGGLNVSYTEHLRLQLQYERAFRPGDVLPGNELSVQVGARF